MFDQLRYAIALECAYEYGKQDNGDRWEHRYTPRAEWMMAMHARYPGWLMADNNGQRATIVSNTWYSGAKASLSA